MDNNKFKSQNYETWEAYLEKHHNISDIDRAEEIQNYEDQIFALVLRLFR
ncbi:MAG: hypothetical protein RR614_07280 [Eubacterium sp.]